MKRPILADYGSDSGPDNKARASDGGRMMPKPLPYSTPCGPKNNMSPGPGLKGGTQHGNAGTQGKR